MCVYIYTHTHAHTHKQTHTHTHTHTHTGVRNVDKATKSLSESSTVVRGAMVQKVAAVDTSAVELTKLDVVAETAAALAEVIHMYTCMYIHVVS
jgi:hypothetical protein